MCQRQIAAGRQTGSLDQESTFGNAFRISTEDALTKIRPIIMITIVFNTNK